MAQIIGISGLPGAGKDSIAKHLLWIELSKHYDKKQLPRIEDIANMDLGLLERRAVPDSYQVKKFARKLKQIASLLLAIPEEKLESQEVKNSLIPYMWWVNDDEGARATTVREFLQKLGTEVFRVNLHSEVWVNALMVDYTPQSKWIITDVRFPNEANAIRSKGGVLLHITKTGNTYQPKHLSDTALDNYQFDHRIEVPKGDFQTMHEIAQTIHKNYIK